MRQYGAMCNFFLNMCIVGLVKPVLRCIPYKQSQILVSFGLIRSMKVIIVVLLTSFCLIEVAHLNYHRAKQCYAAETVDF